MKRKKIIEKLNKFKEEHPEQIISVETPKGCMEFKIGDAVIYEDYHGNIVFDSE